MKALWWLLGILALFAAVVGYELVRYGDLGQSNAGNIPQEARASVLLDGITVHVDLASTPAQQELGLGGRSSLAPDQGMLFVFPEDGQYQFWMKDMSFSIDIIWMDRNGVVVGIVPNLSPSTYPQAFGPEALSRYVLEVPAGFAAAHDVRIGDRATLP